MPPQLPLREQHNFDQTLTAIAAQQAARDAGASGAVLLLVFPDRTEIGMFVGPGDVRNVHQVLQQFTPTFPDRVAAAARHQAGKN